MSFNPDPSKQVQVVIFTLKVKKVIIAQILFNKKSVQQVSSQKHVHLRLDTSLMFVEHIKAISPKFNKIIELSLTTVLSHYNL